jgi:PKD repeat protein
MIGSSRLLVSPSSTIALFVTLLIAAIILFIGNVTIASAQQPPLTNQTAVTQNRTELFQSTEDGIRLNVPQGWQIQDLNNTGPIFSEESTTGYGILAQLCLGEEQQQQGQEGAAPVNANNTNGCQVAQEEVVHIIRYPNLDTRIQATNISNSTTATAAPPTSGASFNNNNQTIATATTIDNVLAYHLQKLREVGYHSIQIVNNVDRSVNLTLAQSNQTVTTLPAKFVEMTYTTASSAPDETRRGYFVLAATNATAPSLGVTKGYSVFYEGNSISAETRPANSSAPRPLPEEVRQVFDSFELVTTTTTAGATATATTTRTEEPLTVEIIASDTEDTSPATFEFEANVTGGREPYSYSWDFGDGSSVEENDEEEVEHTFEEAGSYSVSLTVTDSRGQSASDSIEITLEEPPVEEPPVVEEQATEEEEEEEEDNDSVDVEGAVDDFIDDLFGRLGLR